MSELLLLVALVVVGVVAYVAYRNAQDFSDANEVVPGTPTRAPRSWAGAHTPEARLHRRLRDAMSALRENASLDDPSLADARATLEREALAVDDQLVAVAALAKGHRGAKLEQVEGAVEAIEAAVAEVVTLRGPQLGDVQRTLDDVRTRLRLVADARAELAALDPTSRSLEDLRAQLESDTDGDPGPTATPPT